MEESHEIRKKNGEDKDAGENQKNDRMGEDKVAVLEEYAGLYEENEDMAGWLSVEGTKIDYPVMQGEDDEY